MTEEERRKDARLKRPFIISYKVICSSSSCYDITQVKDISLGGMRFITSQSYLPKTMLSIELKTPFTEERIRLKASVIESKELALNLIYDTRVRFVEMDKEEQEILNKMICVFLKKNL